MPKFNIGKFEYKSKKEATERVQRILNVEGLDPGDNRQIIEELLLMHPRSDVLSIASDTIAIRYDPEHSSSKQFYITFENGTTDAFSYKTCLNGKYNVRQRIIRKFRNSIVDQIVEFRSEHFKRGDHCPLCDHPMATCNVDHVTKFRNLLSQFLATKNQSIESLVANDSSSLLIEEWVKYHADNADLRVICPDCNSKLQ
jgi:hypothetical protein